MTGSTSKRSLPTCTGFYGTEINIQYNTIQSIQKLEHGQAIHQLSSW